MTFINRNTNAQAFAAILQAWAAMDVGEGVETVGECARGEDADADAGSTAT